MFSILFNGHANNTEAFGELSEFGGDVSQYMSLLQGSSAFRYKISSLKAMSNAEHFNK
jgi:hypothetical protein